MSGTLAQRIFAAHLELNFRLGRKVTQAEFGELIAQRMQRPTPFSSGAVSRWESGQQLPTPDVIEAIGELTGVDPGWISHGPKTRAPAPRPGEISGEMPKWDPPPEIQAQLDRIFSSEPDSGEHRALE